MGQCCCNCHAVEEGADQAINFCRITEATLTSEPIFLTIINIASRDDKSCEQVSITLYFPLYYMAFHGRKWINNTHESSKHIYTHIQDTHMDINFYLPVCTHKPHTRGLSMTDDSPALAITPFRPGFKK